MAVKPARFISASISSGLYSDRIGSPRPFHESVHPLDQCQPGSGHQAAGVPVVEHYLGFRVLRRRRSGRSCR